MILFHEWYGTYYAVMARLLQQALHQPLTSEQTTAIIRQYGFEESIVPIITAIKQQRWQLITTEGTTSLENIPAMPLTTLQKRWLKAISQDRRMPLFPGQPTGLEDVEPLYQWEDVVFFDQYSDGDCYEDTGYQQRFRLILDAIKTKKPLHIEMENRKGQQRRLELLPQLLEYSEKDDKFRLIGQGAEETITVNLGRIQSCVLCQDSFQPGIQVSSAQELRRLVLLLTDTRNALERAMLHFAHFRKEAEQLDSLQYRIQLWYQQEDETELLIRILSFGPMLKVQEPPELVAQIRERLHRQQLLLSAMSKGERLQV